MLSKSKEILTGVESGAINIENPKIYGKVDSVSGLLILCSIPNSKVGDLVSVFTPYGERHGEVIGFKEGKAIVMPYEGTFGVSPGAMVEDILPQNTQRVGFGALGRVIDGLGSPLDGKGKYSTDEELSLFGVHTNPLQRKLISEPLDVGVRAINGILTVGKGQRIGIFGGSGIGKSTLLGMMSKHTKADVNVIALVGERGKEVREFLDRILGEDGLKHSVVVAATSDQPPLLRIRAAFLAHTYAEFFRNQGLDVLLVMDSITRFAMAQREVGLASGEPPTARGYTPSVFSLLPKLAERAGCFENGTITAFYTILVEGDDTSEPISDNMRAILDGHFVLSRSLFGRKIMPSIDVLSSISRSMPDIVSKEHLDLSFEFSRTLADYFDAEDLINIGAYKGGNPRVDYAVKKSSELFSYLTQGLNEKVDFTQSFEKLKEIFKKP